MLTRERAENGIIFPDRSGAITGDKTRRDMNQCRSLHSPRKGNHVLRADHIGPQRALESWIEGDVTGAIEDHVDVVRDSLCLFLGVAKIRLADIAAKYDHLVSNEPIQRTAVAFAQRIKGRRRKHAVPKPRL